MDNGLNRADPPHIVVEGLEGLIERDLTKHKAFLERSQTEKQAYAQARAHEIQRKRAWTKHIGGGKFDDDALKVSIAQINQNIAMFSDKVKLSDDAIAHHTEIVDELTASLQQYRLDLAILAQFRKDSDADQH